MSRHWSKHKQGTTADGWWEVGASYSTGVYSINLDLTLYRDRGQVDGFDIRASLVGGDAHIRWTRNLPHQNETAS